MKALDTIIGRLIVGCVFACCLTLNISSFAIEGLQVTLQSSNVVLHWPSTEGENYIVQYRPALNSTSDWTTITSALPADSGTNLTFFIHTNAAQFGWSNGNTNGSGSIDPSNTNGVSSGTNNSASGFGFYRVVKDGVRLLDSSLLVLTNGMLSNSVNIAFEAGYADGSGTNVFGILNSATLMVDGTEFPGSGGVLDSPTNTSPWRFSMDTAYLENGDHTLQVEVVWFDPNAMDENHIYPTRYSDSITITVSNQIYYPQWEEQVGEAGISAYFLKTTCTNADWQIDIYDVSNRLAQTLSGHTDDGIIEAYWNMVDTNGIGRTNSDLDPEFSAMITVADPITKQTPKKIQPKKSWPDQGKWTVAYLDYFKHFYSANNDMQGHINSFANTTAKYGGYYLYYPPSGSTNDIGQTYPMRYYDPNHTNDGVTVSQIAKDTAMLKSFLASTNSRNFFYRGHGGATQIGYVTSSEIAAVVKHRYRFVMLQECESANGNLDHAFGIKGPGKFPLLYYENTGIRPAAFVGNTVETPFAKGPPVTIGGVSYDGQIPWQVPYFYYEFLFYWDTDLEGEQLKDAIQHAIDDLPSSGLGIDPGTKLIIYGYENLRIDEYNHKSNWP